MVLLTNDADFKALHVVRNFDETKPDVQQWDCSEYYRSNAYGKSLNFSAADQALEAERLKLDDDAVRGMYIGLYIPTNTEFIIHAASEEDAIKKMKASNQLVGPLDDEEDSEYEITEFTISKLGSLLFRRSDEYWGCDDHCVIFDD